MSGKIIMVVKIEPVASEEHKIAMLWVRQQIFEREMGMTHGQLSDPDQPGAFHLLGVELPDTEPIAALSVVLTSDDYKLHENYNLRFNMGARVARYSQLAVLKPYRKLNLSLRLILEAHRKFIIPNKVDYTWMLFDAERVASSPVSKRLAFIPSKEAFRSEFGYSRSLVRDERTFRSGRAIQETEQYLEKCSLRLSPDVWALWESPA
jgi:hypothetical protein